jgi:hypothetical protein
VQQPYSDAAQLQGVATVVAHQVRLGNARDPLQAVGFVAIHVDWDGRATQQPGQPLDLLAEDLAAHVVLVVVGDQGAHHLHAVRFGGVAQRVHRPGGVDQQRLA